MDYYYGQISAYKKALDDLEELRKKGVDLDDIFYTYIDGVQSCCAII